MGHSPKLNEQRLSSKPAGLGNGQLWATADGLFSGAAAQAERIQLAKFPLLTFAMFSEGDPRKEQGKKDRGSYRKMANCPPKAAACQIEKELSAEHRQADLGHDVHEATLHATSVYECLASASGRKQANARRISRRNRAGSRLASTQERDQGDGYPRLDRLSLPEAAA